VASLREHLAAATAGAACGALAVVSTPAAATLARTVRLWVDAVSQCGPGLQPLSIATLAACLLTVALVVCARNQPIFCLRHNRPRG
jgi:hypothetical protein